MARTLKVYGVRIIKERIIIATTSKKLAAEILDLPISHLDHYGSITHNKFEITLAMTKPGVPFVKGIDRPDSAYVVKD